MLALVSGIGALFVTHFFRFQGTFALRPATEQMQRAVAAAHWHASTSRNLVHLSFLEEDNLLRIQAVDGTLLETFPLPEGGSFEITFFRILPEERVETEPQFEIEDFPLSRVTFSPVGSPPFMVELAGLRRQTNLYFDAFSALPLLVQAEI